MSEHDAERLLSERHETLVMANKRSWGDSLIVTLLALFVLLSGVAALYVGVRNGSIGNGSNSVLLMTVMVAGSLAYLKFKNIELYGLIEIVFAFGSVLVVASTKLKDVPTLTLSLIGATYVMARGFSNVFEHRHLEWLRERQEHRAELEASRQRQEAVARDGEQMRAQLNAAKGESQTRPGRPDPS